MIDGVFRYIFEQVAGEYFPALPMTVEDDQFIAFDNHFAVAEEVDRAGWKGAELNGDGHVG